MPVLYALSILAVAALFWAAITIVGTVRRAKRRRERRVSGAADLTSVTTATLPVSSASPPPMPGPPRLRNFPSRLGEHPVTAPVLRGTEWNPFASSGGDFADLSDPTPGGRRLRPPSRRRHSSDKSDPSDRTK